MLHLRSPGEKVGKGYWLFLISQRGLWQSMSDNVKLTPYYIIDIKVLPPH